MAARRRKTLIVCERLPRRDPRRATDADARSQDASIDRDRPLESRMLGNVSSPVRRGADGKGRSRLPVTAAQRAHEPRHKPYLASRLPYEDIKPHHIAEAVGYRSLDRSVWA